MLSWCAVSIFSFSPTLCNTKYFSYMSLALRACGTLLLVLFIQSSFLIEFFLPI